MTLREEDKETQKELYRFIQDLEFVQCLANPNYLAYLSMNNYFKQKEFINYIEYLQYFKQGKYLKYITYSRSIIFLDLLRYEFFRQALETENFIRFLTNAIHEDWNEVEKVKSIIVNHINLNKTKKEENPEETENNKEKSDIDIEMKG